MSIRRWDTDSTTTSRIPRVILTRLDVKDGRLVLPDGMSYEILVLPERDDMNPDVLRKIAELVKKGATVVGPKPSRSNGLSRFRERDQGWYGNWQVNCGGRWDGRSILERPYGKGKLIWGKPLYSVLAGRGGRAGFQIYRHAARHGTRFHTPQNRGRGGNILHQ